MKTLLFSLIALAACPAIIGQTSTTLKLNPEKNKVYRFSSETEQTIVQTVNGNQQTTESQTKYSVSMKMMDATADFIVAEFRFDTIHIRTNAMGRVSVMGSALEGNAGSGETSEIISYFLNRMTKTPVFAKIDYTGKVTEVLNTKMLAGMILKDTALITLAAPQGPAVKKQVAGMIDDEAFKIQIEMFTHHLPGKTAATGETWSTTRNTNAGGMSLEIITKSSLESMAGNKATILAESTIAAAPNAAPIQSGGATVTYDSLRGLGKSTTVIDAATGLVIETSSKSRISGTLGVSVPGMSMEIPMDIDSTSKITSL